MKSPLPVLTAKPKRRCRWNCSPPQPPQFRGLAEVIAVVGGEALGAVEEDVDSRFGRQRHSGHGLLEDGFEMVEILGDARRLGVGLESAKQDVAGILLVIGTVG